MSSSFLKPHQDSSSSAGVGMDISNHDEEVDIEENVDEMSEEELETIDEGASELTANPFEKATRQKKSIIWDNMELVKYKNGNEKMKCKHCLRLFVKSGATTSHHRRHVLSCLQRKLNTGTDQTKGKQQVLSFSDSSAAGITSITNFSYNHAKVRELASHMVLVHEYPFLMMDHYVFNLFMKVASPFYKKITRQQVRDDCYTTYDVEKKKLKFILKCASRVSITTDMWKSGQKIQYMVVTAHFVDSDWVLQKRVLNFCNVPPPHSGAIVCDALNNCFIEWGIENKISSITVYNASYNDVCIRRLKEDFALTNRLSIGGKIFQVRCCAHILNLLVQDGLKHIEGVIDVVRDGIKYLRNSESRLIQFGKIAQQLQLSSRKLILDCTTRWNSTYLMLASGLEFKDVFPRYKNIDLGFNYVPSQSDWSKVEDVCQFLGIFYEITNMISGSDYPTSNLFLVELYRIKEILNEKSLDFSPHMRAMSNAMTEKFDKYWGESNVLLSFGAILDPRYKMVLVDHVFPIIYGEVEAVNEIAKIKDLLYELYNEYVGDFITSHAEESSGQPGQPPKRKHNPFSPSSSSQGKNKKFGVLTGKEKFLMHVSEIDKAPPEKSDLDLYLEEGRYCCDASANLDVLSWWKGERLRFPILSRMACDILSIPITTVASESTFSAGGRIIDDRRASMSVDTVEVLLCGNDWIRNLYGLKTKTRDPSNVFELSTFQEIEIPRE